MSDSLRPDPSTFSAAWWEALRHHDLQLQRCRACQRAQFPPLPGCRRCGSPELDVEPAVGTGVVYSWIVAQYAFAPDVADDIPYVVATVELTEGPRMYGRLVGCHPNDVRAGMPVRVRFQDHADHTVVAFAPAQPVEDIPGFV